MTFKQWDEDIDGQPIVFGVDSMREIWTDWKVEREKLIGALKRITNIDYEDYGHDFAEALGAAKDKARAVLAKVGDKAEGRR